MNNKVKLLGLNLLLIFVLLLPADWLIGKLMSPGDGTSNRTAQRNVNLREWRPMLDIDRTPAAGEMAGIERLEQKPYRLRTDINGLIIGPGQMLDNKRADIVFFGGSTTECMYVDEADRFPYLVGKNLQLANGQPAVALNGGVSGNHSMHSTINLLAKGVPLKPRVVVLMNNVNDLSLLAKTGSYWTAPLSRTVVRDPVEIRQLAAQQQTQREQSRSGLQKAMQAIYPNTCSLLAACRDKPASGDEWDGFRFSLSDFNLEAMKTGFRNSLQQFVAIAQANGIEPVLMTQFNRIRLNDDFTRQQYEQRQNPLSYAEFVNAYESFNEIIREVANANSLLLIDLDREIPANVDYIYDAAHVNSKGSQLAAKIIAENLAENFEYFQLAKTPGELANLE